MEDQSTRVVEYTDCTSAEGWHSTLKQCPVCDTKQSGGEATVILEIWGCGVSFIAIVPRSTLARSVALDRILSQSQIDLFDF